MVIKDRKILLVKRNKAPQKGKWAIPGGSVKLGETLQAAAEREIEEETGLMIRANGPIHVFDLIERNTEGEIAFHYVIVDLQADYVGGEIRAADDVSAAGWFSLDEVEDLDVSRSTVQLLRNIYSKKLS